MWNGIGKGGEGRKGDEGSCGVSVNICFWVGGWVVFMKGKRRM